MDVVEEEDREESERLERGGMAAERVDEEREKDSRAFHKDPREP